MCDGAYRGIFKVNDEPKAATLTSPSMALWLQQQVEKMLLASVAEVEVPVPTSRWLLRSPFMQATQPLQQTKYHIPTMILHLT